MSYPKNAATPPIVVVGVVVQISDGAVQTTGASVRVKTGTGAWGAGSGTLACDTTSGVWTYAPTQGETNDEAFHVAVYKASCIPAGVTVITSASATAGKVVLSGETHTSAVIPTVTSVTNAVTLPSSATINITGNITGNLSGSVGSVTGAVGSVTGSVGSISGVTFPTNFGVLAITGGGAVTAGTVSDKTGYSLADGSIITATFNGTCVPPSTTGDVTLVTRLGTPANFGSGMTIADNLIDIESQTDDIGAAGAGLTAAPGNRIANSTTAATNLAALYDALETGTAQAGGASSITLRTGASATTDYYKDQAVFILSGTGADQTNRITAYNGTTKVATVGTAWAVQPDNTSVYVVLGRIG